MAHCKAVIARLTLACLLALGLAFGLVSGALAQSEISVPSEPDAFVRALDVETTTIGAADDDQLVAPVDVQPSDWTQALDDLEAELSREQLSVTALAALRDDVNLVRDEIAAYVTTLQPRLAEQRSLLEGLAPADVELADTPEILAQRERIDALERQLQPAELVLARSTALRETIVSRRAEAFTNQLFARSQSITAPALWSQGLVDLPRLVQRSGELAVNSWESVRARATPAAFAGLGVLFIFLVVLAIPLRRFALSRAARKKTQTPEALDKTLGALRIVLLSFGVPVVGFALLLTGIDAVGGLSLRAKAIVNTLALNITLYFLISGMIRAFLAPGLIQWRLVPIADGYAGRAALFFRIAALAYISGEILRALAAVFVSPLEVVQLLEAVPMLVSAFAVLGGMRSVLRGLGAHAAEQDENTTDTPPLMSILWRWTIPVSAILSLVTIGAQLFGFLALAAFLIDRLVWTALVLAALHLAALLVDGLSAALFQEDARTSRWVHTNVGLSPQGLGQFGVLLAGAVKLVLIIAAASFVIAPFGVETLGFTDILRRVFTGIEIGGFSFSLTSIFVAMGIVAIGVVLTRGIQGWLENRYLPRTKLDTGLKASIRTGVGYVGIIIAAVIGLSHLGLNLENVALVAGALSVGIGFGLQSIVSNFVSGLILLAERPFKQGDWIVVGDEQGIVKRINVRATELQTFDRATVLIPNQDFIAGTVKNRVHRDTLGRIDVPVGVGYDSDPQVVKEILLEIANAHPMTLSYPEPAAFFVEFGTNSLDFMLFAYLADVGNGYGVRSDIRFEIFKRFKEVGIEIPFAQSDVTIRNLDAAMAALAQAGIKAPEGVGVGGLTADTVVETTGVQTVPSPVPAADIRRDRTVDDVPDISPDDGPAGRS